MKQNAGFPRKSQRSSADLLDKQIEKDEHVSVKTMCFNEDVEAKNISVRFGFGFEWLYFVPVQIRSCLNWFASGIDNEGK